MTRYQFYSFQTNPYGSYDFIYNSINSMEQPQFGVRLVVHDSKETHIDQMDGVVSVIYIFSLYIHEENRLI